jgi:hypothetical protein
MRVNETKQCIPGVDLRVHRVLPCGPNNTSIKIKIREHSGNIPGTFDEHINIQGTFREHSGNIQGTFSES